MMRYINLDNQIINGARKFAFYDTVVDKFVSIDGEVVWDSVAELDEGFNNVIHDYDTNIAQITRVEELRERLIGLARGNHALEETPEDD